MGIAGVFAIERVTSEIYGQMAGSGRIPAPPGYYLGLTLTESLGSALGRSQAAAKFFKIDAGDFWDFALNCTSPLAGVHLGAFRDGCVSWFECLDRAPASPAFEAGAIPALSMLDGWIAREGPFVSLGARFALHFGQGIGDTLIATLDLAPDIDASQAKHLRWGAWNEWNHLPLAEWCRTIAHAPVEPSDQWTLATSGDRIDEAITHQPGAADALSKGKEWIARRFDLPFELTRQLMRFRDYIDSVVDLLVDELVQAPPRPEPTGRAAPTTARPWSPIVYRTIRSVRVVRPTMPRLGRKWTAPSYRFAVAGHWRRLPQQAVVGHSPAGETVVGRTWVHDFWKGPDAYSSGVEIQQRVPRVVINIKETLSYARAVLAAYQRQAEEEIAASPASAAPEGPPAEWKARERSKLNSAVRYLILKRDTYRCQLCGASAVDQNGVRLEVDHRVPIEKWGRTVEDNLWTLCQTCNRGKHTQDL